MEQLCLCSVMLNQFILNSKLKLGFHYGDISDVENKGRDHGALKRVDLGDLKPQSPSGRTLLSVLCQSDQILVGLPRKRKTNQTSDSSDVEILGVGSWF